MNEYNGWKNKFTWLVNLWLTNEEAVYLYWLDAIDQAKGTNETPIEQAITLARRLEDEVEEQVLEKLEPYGLAYDLLNTALGHVDWFEIAENWLEGSET